MEIDPKITKIMNKNGISLFGVAAYKDCAAANKRLYEECKDMKSVIIFAVPYKTENVPDDGYKMSCYARVYDYHGYFARLFDSLIKDFESEFPSNVFRGFADHSPINEKQAAANASLGVIGKNTLLITKEYGSFVFLGSVITDLETESVKNGIASCLNCGRCAAACPGGAIGENGFDAEKCISGITQKKSITDAEKKKIKANNAVWGCDVCQNVCPLNKGALATSEKYFTESYIKSINYDYIKNMSEEEFAKYPFSWRKKDVILRNIELCENHEK